MAYRLNHLLQITTVLRNVLVLVAGVSFFLMINPALHAKNARKLSLHDLNGNAARLSDFDGRVVVVNFWATWCLPCREELPRLAAIARQYDSSNVPFVLVSIDDPKSTDNVRRFVAQQQLTLPVWIGASTETLEHYSNKGIVPATIILDERGEIIRIINGQARDEDVKEALDWLLAGRKGPTPEAVVKRY